MADADGAVRRVVIEERPGEITYRFENCPHGLEDVVVVLEKVRWLVMQRLLFGDQEQEQP